VGFFVLNKSFNNDDKEDWTSEEFEESILPGRHGKASLLGKNTHIYLSEGLGSLKGISFSHTRDPLPKINVRLGARVVDSSGGIRIREAISNHFVVKDRRSSKYIQAYYICFSAFANILIFWKSGQMILNYES
jgi:hypothetical protein